MLGKDLKEIRKSIPITNPTCSASSCRGCHSHYHVCFRWAVNAILLLSRKSRFWKEKCSVLLNTDFPPPLFLQTAQLAACLASLARGCRWAPPYYRSEMLGSDERTCRELMDIMNQLALHYSLRIPNFPISKSRKG